MIVSFRDKRTEALFHRKAGHRGLPADLIDRARRKLMAIDAAARIADLALPPSNRLEVLKGNRAGQYSIRVNDQWRLCFRWLDGDAHDVEFCDYH